MKCGWAQGEEGFSPPAFLAFNLNVPKDVKLGDRARHVEKHFLLLYQQEQSTGKGRTPSAQMRWRKLSLPQVIPTFPIINKPGPRGQAGCGPAQGQGGRKSRLPREAAPLMASMSEVTEPSQPARCRASPSGHLLPLTSSVGKAEAVPGFSAGKPWGSTAPA